MCAFWHERQHGTHNHRIDPPTDQPQLNVGLVGVLIHLLGDAVNSMLSSNLCKCFFSISKLQMSESSSQRYYFSSWARQNASMPIQLFLLQSVLLFLRVHFPWVGKQSFQKVFICTKVPIKPFGRVESFWRLPQFISTSRKWKKTSSQWVISHPIRLPAEMEHPRSPM